MSPGMKLVWLYFHLRKRLGLAKIGQPPRKPARPSRTQLRGLNLSKAMVRGFEVIKVGPQKVRKRVVYLHGGGYVQPIAPQHWSLITELARESEAEFLVPLYGLAPRHTVDDALELMESIRNQVDFAVPTFLMGDSAGGGLALALAQSTWQELEKLILISPWVSSEFGDESSIYAKRDPWLNPESLKYIATIWSASANYARKEVSPLNGEMSQLPPTIVYGGDYELFYPQLKQLHQKIKSAGIDCRFVEQTGGLHVFPLIPSLEGWSARKALIQDLTFTDLSQTRL